MQRRVQPGGTSQALVDALPSTAPSRRWISLALAALLASIALLAWHATLLARFAIDWPLHDDFTQILAVPGYLVQLDWPGKLALLFSLTPEHRIVTLRLAGWLGSALPGGLDFKALILAGNAMLIAAGACVVACYPAAFRVAATLLATMLLTSSAHYGAQYWATGALQHFGTAFHGVAALLLVARGRSAWAVPFALAAAFTSANGLCVFAAVPALLALQGRRRAAFAWVAGGIVIAALYFIGYATPPGRPGLLDLLADPASLVAFSVATIGGIGGTFGVQLIAGAAVVVACTWLLASGGWRSVPPVVIAGLVYFGLSCAMIAAGRANLGIEGVAISRYRVYSAFAVLFTLAALVFALPSRSGRGGMAAAIGFAAVAYGWAWHTHAPYILELAMKQAAARAFYAAEGSGVYEAYTREFGDFTLRRAEELGVYRGAARATPAAATTAGTPPAEAASGSAHVEVHRGERALGIAGHVVGTQRPADLWLVSETHAYRSALPSARVWMAPGEARTGFYGALDLTSLPRGRYRVAVASADAAWPNVAIIER